VEAGDHVAEGEAKPGATGVAPAGRVGSGEALEE
jgi:hypothetical protein